MNKKNIYIFIYKMSTIVVQQIMSQKKKVNKNVRFIIANIIKMTS